MNIDLSLAARDGAVLAIGACALLAGLLRFNPGLFLAHYPEAVRKVAPPKTGWVAGQAAISALVSLSAPPFLSAPE